MRHVQHCVSWHVRVRVCLLACLAKGDLNSGPVADHLVPDRILCRCACGLLYEVILYRVGTHWVRGMREQVNLARSCGGTRDTTDLACQQHGRTVLLAA